MGHPWTEQLEELGLTSDSASPPPERDGEWLQALAEFRKLGFARLLVSVDKAGIALHAGHPEIDQEFAMQLETALRQRTNSDWSVEESDGTWWLLSDAIDESERTPALATVLRLAESLRDDQPDWDWLTRESEDTPHEKPDEKTESSNPFETIGDEGDSAKDTVDPGSVKEEARDASGFSFDIAVEDETLCMTLVFATTLSSDRDEVEQALTRNLRAKFDIKVEVLDAGEVRALDAPYPRSVALRLTPTSLTGDAPPSLQECEQGIGEYLETIESLAEGGIDPLVFLGVRDSTREPQVERPEADRPETSVRSEKTNQPEEVFFLVSDDDEYEAADTDSVVLSSADIADDAPLTTGRFDDPRLDEPDANTSLVDVVLRHPGYSDRRVGQVLSILFSIEYYEALRLMKAAPLVIARGVSNERGHTIQNVVDGAGGRVKLAEPDRFPIGE